MQASFSELEYASKKKQTRRDVFLSQLEAITPWSQMVGQLQAFYPKGDGPGRPPIGLERMLRMYVAQQCFGFSDEGIEDAIYDSQAIRRFVGVDLSRESAPDATTLLHFRHLLEEHGLTKRLFETINAHLAEHGLLMREGTIVDATLIAAPPSTKNRDKSRDPEMHQSKKGKQWHFGMKAHIGADAQSGLVHTVVCTAAHVADLTQAHALLHGQETDVLGDAGYQGVEKRPENKAAKHTWHIAMRPGKRRMLGTDKLGRLMQRYERLKAGVRAKVEHPFHVLKNLFGHRKTRYRGLKKNSAHLFSLFALVNLVLAKRPLLALNAQDAP